MPEYLTPGVYIDELPRRSRPIEPVGTTVAGFVGPAPTGPVDGEPALLTSLADFERVYGDNRPLVWDGVPRTNYLWHAARAFFAEGGRELYVARVFRPAAADDAGIAGGNDGRRPGAADYARALDAFEAVDDIAIVAAPGATDPFDDVARAIQGLLLAHAERMRFRFAVLDSGPGMTIAEVRQQRRDIDSAHGALYYPWVRVMDPISHEPIHLPPSGFVAGIYVRNDIERGVSGAPANAVVNLAAGFEQALTTSQQDVLNPEGINCFRVFEGRGYRLWGARTVSSDPEWRYVNVRRYLSYLERSIARGIQWVAFEPNGEPLWTGVRRAVEDFLFREWRNGALVGDRPDRAFFVRCDRATVTQADIDSGRLVCEVGVAVLRPAEFMILRIVQWTGDHRP